MGLFRRRSKDLFTIPVQAAGAAPADVLPVGAQPVAPGGFRMIVEDVFVIHGRGAVVTGTVEAGAVSVGGRVTVEHAGQTSGPLVITGIEKFRKIIDVATAGDRIGLLFRDVARGQIVRGDVLRS
jgi:translation elongation factor EF-Tu-like GTPase